MIDKKTTVKRMPDTVSAKIEDMTVFMSIEAGKYYGLDEIAVRIWDLCEHPISVEKIIETLMAEYEVSQEDCERDVIAFLQELWKEKLVTAEPID